MYRRLKILVPLVQILSIACVVILSKKVLSENQHLLYVLPLRQFVLNLNYPLVLASYAVVLVSAGSSNALTPIMSSGWSVIAVLVTVVLTAFCVSLFWYAAITEAQMRTRGQSLMRFRNKWLELAKIIVFMLLGAGSMFRAYREIMWPIEHHLSRLGLWPLEIVFGSLLLVIWALVLIAISLQDLGRLRQPFSTMSNG